MDPDDCADDEPWTMDKKDSAGVIVYPDFGRDFYSLVMGKGGKP